MGEGPRLLSPSIVIDPPDAPLPSNTRSSPDHRKVTCLRSDTRGLSGKGRDSPCMYPYNPLEEIILSGEIGRRGHRFGGAVPAFAGQTGQRLTRMRHVLTGIGIGRGIF